MNSNKTRQLASSLAALAMLAAGPALADSLTIDFEPSTYTPGTIDLQDGWSSFGPYDQEVVDSTGFGYGSFGDQSLRISNAVVQGSFGDQTFSKSLLDEAGESDAENGGLSGGTRQPYFSVQWDFASTVPGAEQPDLQIVASPDRGDGARMSYIRMADTSSGLEVSFYDYQGDPGDFVFSVVASDLDRAVPHTIKVEMFFVEGTDDDIVAIYVDGTLRHVGTSWEDYFRDVQPPGSRTVDSILFRAAGTAAPASMDKGLLIDNLSMYSGPMPTNSFVTGGGWIDSPEGAYKPDDMNVPALVWDQGFETGTDGWSDDDSGWAGWITQVPSGTDGIASSMGGYHAIAEGDGSTAPFSRFDGYRDMWTGSWTAEIDVYLDPAWTNGQGFDYSVAANGSDGAHQRDYIFHVTKDTSTGDLLVAGSNNTNFVPREDLETINHYVVATAGWYTLQHIFYDTGGVLFVDMNLLDSLGTVVFTETRSDAGDLIPSVVGGNRYSWFTFINVAGGIAVDDHQLVVSTVIGKANFGFVAKFEKKTKDPVGNTEFVFQAADLNFHSTSYNFLAITGSSYAKFKGMGTINGDGDYNFMVWAGDNEPDTFRIKIWEEDGGVETVVYDNGTNQAIGGGNITIHTKKKK